MYIPGIDRFSKGIRCLLLIHRQKDGGRERADYHAEKRISMDENEFYLHLGELVVIQDEYDRKGITKRLYVSVNSRNMEKAIRQFRREQIEIETYCDADRYRFYTDIKNRFFGCLNKPQSKTENNFLFDIDVGQEIQTREDITVVIDELKKHTEIITTRPTPNGFHIVTEPFNYTVVSYEMKRDALLFIR